jgi:hypothetical protein
MAIDPPPARLGVSLGTLVFAGLFTVAASAAAALALLHFSPKPVPPAESVSPAQPFTQQGAVNADTAASTTVYYPVPFSSPPNLTLTTKSGGRKYAVVRQDELGFTWLAVDATLVLDPSKPPEVKPDPKPSAGPHEFAWEAKGVTGKADLSPRPFEQTGEFRVLVGGKGAEYFPRPYAAPPNVTTGSKMLDFNVFVTEVTATGFQWECKEPAPTSGGGFREVHRTGEMLWTAKGILATTVRAEPPSGK